jgi:prepilin-type N-terminal cleavage/methylation domain-containing protein
MMRAKLTANYGFTLIEVLVSLVVFSLAIAVISEALFQSTRLLTLVESGNGRLSSQWREIRSLKEAVANMTVEVDLVSSNAVSFNAQTRRQQGLKGDAAQFTVWTQRHPLDAPGAVRHLAANLVPFNQSLNLMVGWANVEPTSSKQSILAAKLVGGTQFAYQDTQGMNHPRWPALGKELELLPHAILLLSESGQNVLSVWPFDGPVMSNEYNGGASFLDLVGTQQR